jgi:hypothetical protein
MTSIRRSFLVLLALAAGLGAVSLPGRAQGPSARYAFADTTLLRDTLGLRFDRLFETADSLQMLPDSLRAQIIRFRLPMRRLLAMADSMGVPVDSVGVVIDRERFNPLSSRFAGAGQTSFRYTSSYDIGRITTTWTNGGDYSLQRGNMLLTNSTSITLQRTNSSSGLSLHQDRLSLSTATWKLRPSLAVGGKATLSGFDQSDPGSVANVGERKHEFQLTSKAQPRFSKALTTELNLLGGYLDVNSLSLIKRGLSGDVNGRSRYVRGNWLSHDVTGGVNGNLSRTRQPTSSVTLGTHDFASTVRGGLQLYQNTPVGLNANYSARRSSVENPTVADTVNRIITSSATADATVRLRASNDRYLNLAGNLGTNTTTTGVANSQGSRADGRWVQGPWKLEANISDAVQLQKFAARPSGGGYNDHTDNRQASGTLQRPFGRKLIGKLQGSIGLTQTRSEAVVASARPSTPRDSYRQSYRIETLYNPSERFSSGVALEVGLVRAINLPATSTANNTDTRSYRAEWRWTHRLLRGLTASQANTVQSDYQFYPFAPERNKLTLDYSSFTTLNVTLTPRVSLDITHNARQQPGGEWRVLPDGSGVLLPSDESKNYTLRTAVSWHPSPALGFTLTPEYVASDRTGTVNGVESPTSRNRRLSFNGGANLDLPVGRSGHLTGSISRLFTDNRSTSFVGGQPVPSPRSEQDNWNGSLQFSWDLGQ